MTEMAGTESLNRIWSSLLSCGEDGLSLTGLAGASHALILARLEIESSNPLLIITATPSEAEKMLKDLRFFLRGSSLPEESLCLFPQWEVLPYDDKAPHPEIVRERMDTLSRLLHRQALIVVTTIRALLQRILPRKALLRGCLKFRVGDTVNPDRLAENLLLGGYHQHDLVEVPGTFSRRGGIFDLYPPNRDCPVRLEFFGDEIESIRLFSPLDQRSTETIPHFETLPSREILLDRTAKEYFRKRPGASSHPLASKLEEALLPEGIEFYTPLFTPAMESLFDYMPENTMAVLFHPDEISHHAESFFREVQERYDIARHQGRVPCGTGDLYISPDEFNDLVGALPTLRFDLLSREKNHEIRFRTESIGGLSLPGKSRIQALIERVRPLKEKTRILLVARTNGQADRLMEILSGEEEIPCSRFADFAIDQMKRGVVSILVGTLSAGFRFPLFDLTCLTEDEIFGVKRIHRPAGRYHEGPFLPSLSELKEGDYVVHVDHGIGKYRGLREVTVEGIARDLIRIEYANHDFLYVPPEKIHLIQKYSASDGHSVRIHPLGGTGWEKLKGKVRRSIEEMSRELIELYARRRMVRGFSFSPPDRYFREFEETFEYEETPDQKKAIEDVLADMQKAEPMDRLICGDVGYGKTEVAMRAAFKAALDGKQVAILVPTTLLARQHYDSFRQRFRSFPVQVEMLSRFRSRGEQKKILAKVRKGEIDILIGTHRLLSKDISFQRLGLVIIDEEQRFGVRHKETFKKLRHEVDVLTLTATPIPRTLEMTFMGIRDISIINTPPEDRMAVYTRVARFSEEIVREAVRRELDRGGQVFFVHNRVRDIDRIAAMVRRILPEARMGVAHGQMEEQRLEEVMLRFVDREIDILVSTSIIESGLDIPNANTMIIHRPEEFGLGQLYQLRGRIGRTRHRAYAYLLTRADRSMTREARQRLQVIQELTELGSGFQLAARDLEIRGAGNLLGAQQSGFIAAVGFDLYMQLVNQVARKIKGETEQASVEPDVQMQVSARIPKTYIREDRLRLDLYRRLAILEDPNDLERIADEIRDRFGAPPLETENLFRLIDLRILCRRLRIRNVREQARKILFTFDPKTPISRERMLHFIRSHPDRIQLPSEYQVELSKQEGSFQEVCNQAKNFLQELI